jgi:5-carboxymethyl-2-hydroxymuconate isomerase
MPHIVIEYSSNLRERLNLEQFVREVHDATVETGEFPMAGLKTRTSERTCYRVADGHPDNAFVHVVLRFRPGKDPVKKYQAGEKVFAAICNHLAPIYDSSPLGITFEMQEIDTDFRFLKSNLGDYVKRREGAPVSR